MIYKDIDIESFKLKKINIVNNSVDILDSEPKKGSEKYQYELTLGIKPALRKENKKSIRITLKIGIAMYVAQTKRATAKAEFQIDFFFESENLKNYIRVKDELESVESDLIIGLASVGYTISIGIVLTKTQGTIMQKMVMPTMSVEYLDGLFAEIMNSDK